jgi:hypothetical protein
MGNEIGISAAGTVAVVETLGNNTVRQNDTNTSGNALMPVSPM